MGNTAHDEARTDTAASSAPLRRGASAYLAVAAVLMFTVWLSAEQLAPGEAGLIGRPTVGVADGVLGPWMYWDGGAFEDIARNGYRQADRAVYDAGGESRIAYFPGYPLVARGVGELVRDVPLGMILVTFASGLGAVLLFVQWLRDRTEEPAATWALAALLVFPWSYFLVATGYSDALFLVAALGAFVLMKRDRPFAAMACGFLATMTRPVGAAVTLGLLVIALQRVRAEQGQEGGVHSRTWRSPLVVLASIGGLVCFMGFCWARYGQPLAFSIAQRGWGQESGPHTWFKLTFIDVINDFDDPFFELRLTVQGVVALLFAAAIPAVWKRFGPAYGAYTALVVLVPLIGSATFASLGRYMLVAFPVFALLGETLARWAAARRWAYLAASAVGLLVNASFWARGYWMA